MCPTSLRVLSGKKGIALHKTASERKPDKRDVYSDYFRCRVGTIYTPPEMLSLGSRHAVNNF